MSCRCQGCTVAELRAELGAVRAELTLVRDARDFYAGQLRAARKLCATKLGERNQARRERDQARDLAATLEAELARTPQPLDLTQVADDAWGGVL